MQVRVKLMGMFRLKAPEGNKLKLSNGATIDDALKALDIPGDHVHLVMVNGQHETDRGRTLEPDDELMVMPPVGGG